MGAVGDGDVGESTREVTVAEVDVGHRLLSRRTRRAAPKAHSRLAEAVLQDRTGQVVDGLALDVQPNLSLGAIGGLEGLGRQRGEEVARRAGAGLRNQGDGSAVDFAQYIDHLEGVIARGVVVLGDVDDLDDVVAFAILGLADFDRAGADVDRR